MIQIGDIELPIVYTVEDDTEANVSEIKSELDSVVVKHTPSVQTINISGFMNKEMHSKGLTLDRQKERLNLLRDRDTLENPFVYKRYKGYLFIEEVNFSQNPDSRIVNEFEIVARYYPWPKYYKNSEP